MNADRYEIVPRPDALGGGWRLHVFGKDPESGETIEIGGGVFPVLEGQDSRDVYADALETAQTWLAVDEAEFVPGTEV